MLPFAIYREETNGGGLSLGEKLANLEEYSEHSKRIDAHEASHL